MRQSLGYRSEGSQKASNDFLGHNMNERVREEMKSRGW